MHRVQKVPFLWRHGRVPPTSKASVVNWLEYERLQKAGMRKPRRRRMYEYGGDVEHADHRLACAASAAGGAAGGADAADRGCCTRIVWYLEAWSGLLGAVGAAGLALVKVRIYPRCAPHAPSLRATPERLVCVVDVFWRELGSSFPARSCRQEQRWCDVPDLV